MVNEMGNFQIEYAKKLIFFIPLSVISVVLNVGLNLWLIPQYAALGAAVATCIAAIVTAVCGMAIGHHLFPVLTQWRRLFGFVLCQILLIAAVFAILIPDIDPIVKILVKLGIIGVYGAVALTLGWVKWQRIVDAYFAMRKGRARVAS